MFKFLLILSLFISVSCTNSHMTLSGRDGRTGVVRKQTPEFNRRYMEKQRRFGSTGNIRNNRARPEVKNNDGRKSIQNIEKDVVANNSTAYTSKSVLDKNKNNNNVGKIVERNYKLNNSIIKESEPKVKNLEDFDYIPDDVFDDAYMLENNDRNGYNRGYNQNVDYTNHQYMNDDYYIEIDRPSDKKRWKFWSNNSGNSSSNKKSWWKFWSKDENTQDYNIYSDYNGYDGYNDSNDVYNYYDDNYYDMQYANEQEQYYNKEKYNNAYNNRINSAYSDGNSKMYVDCNKKNNVSERYTCDTYNKNLKKDCYQDQQPRYRDAIGNNYVDYQDNYNDGYYNNDYYNNYDNRRADLRKNNYSRDQKKCENFQQSNNYFKGNANEQNNSISEVSSQLTKLIKGKYYVQVIYTKSKNGCDSVLARLNAKNTGIVQTVTVNGSIYYKGLIGPYSTQTQANLEKERIINMGHYDVFTFKER